MRSQLLARIGAAIAACACITVAAQAPYPNRTVTLIVPYSPGASRSRRVPPATSSRPWGARSR